jgi:hypothetical protein
MEVRRLRQRLCEALYATSRIKEAAESVLNIVNTVDEDVYTTGPIVTWVSGKSCYLFLRYAFDILPQISRNNVSPPPKAVLTQPSIHHPPRRS